MKNLLPKYGPWALVCGSADGLGAAYSKALARRGFHLLMVDYQLDKLDSLSRQLANDYDIQTVALHLDLCVTDSFDSIIAELKQRDCGLMVYNAAYGPVKMFVDNEPDELDKYLRVNSSMPLRLAHYLASNWIHSRRKGAFVFMGSLAGLRGTQMVAPYAAAKAFQSTLAEALHFELKDFGIDVLGVCPGTMRTGPYLSSLPQKMPGQPPIQEPDDVAEEVLRSIGKKVVMVPGLYNKLTNGFLNLLPRRMALGIMNNSMRKIYPHIWRGPEV